MRNFSISFLLTGIILSVVYKNNHDIPSGSGSIIGQIYELCSDTVEMDTNRYFLETYLCSNISGKNGNSSDSITALIYLLDARNQQIPKNVYIRNIFVVKEEDTWASSPATSQTGMAKFMLTQVNAGNSEEEKFNVDVIVEITDSLSSETYYVIARNQSFSDL